MFRFILYISAVVAVLLLTPLCGNPVQAGVRDDAAIFYTFDETSGTTATDSGTIGNDATLFGLNFGTDGVAGKFDGALHFDGTDYAQNTMDLGGGGGASTITGADGGAWGPGGVSPFTQALWVKVDSDLSPGDPGLAFTWNQDNDPGGGLGTSILWDTDCCGATTGLYGQFFANTGATHRVSEASTTLTAGVWTHLALTYDGAALKLFVDGAQTATAAWTAMNIGLQDMLIGGFPTSGAVGAYDEVGYWKHALSLSELAELQAPDVPGLIPTHTWNSNVLSDWNTGTNWSPNGIPNGSTAIVGFGDAITSPHSVSTNVPVTVNGMVFGDTNAGTVQQSYTIAGSGTVTLAPDASVPPAVSVLEGSHEFTVAVNLTDSADIDVVTGSSMAFNNVMNLNGNTLTKTNVGMMSINGTVTTGVSGSVVVEEGVANGTGEVVGDLTNTGGTVSPGLSPGKLTVDGDYDQTSGSLLMEIDGTTAETQYDVLDVTGDLSITGGSLDVVLGFVPAAGDVFDILNFGSINLTVSPNLDTLPLNLAWDSSQLTVNGSLSVISIVPTVEWTSDASGDWNSTLNWTPTIGMGSVPNSNIEVAVFGNAITAPRTVFTAFAVTVKEIMFGDTNASTVQQSYNIAGSSVTLDSDTSVSTITVLEGSHELQAVVNLTNATTVDTAAGTSLAFNNALNLDGNTLTKTGAGTMSINNDLNTGGGAIVIAASGGVVGGGGTVGGDLTNNGATVAPGNSPGTLTVAGNYLQTAGSLAVEIDGSAAGEFDVLAVTGNLTVSGGDLDVAFDALPGKFQILDVTGSSSVAFDAINNTGGLNVLFDGSLLDSTGELIVNSAELGDMNDDLLVNTADAALFVQALVDPTGYNANNFFVVSADFNGDVDGSGTFDLGDLSAFSGLLGGPASASTVPEPSSILLFAFALMLCATNRRC